MRGTEEIRKDELITMGTACMIHDIVISIRPGNLSEVVVFYFS